MSEAATDNGAPQEPTHVLAYRKMASPLLWPIRPSLAVLIFSFLLQAVFLPCLCGHGTLKVNFAYAVDGLFIARLILARLLGETNRGWIFYYVLLLTSFAWITLLTESETIHRFLAAVGLL